MLSEVSSTTEEQNKLEEARNRVLQRIQAIPIDTDDDCETANQIETEVNIEKEDEKEEDARNLVAANRSYLSRLMSSLKATIGGGDKSVNEKSEVAVNDELASDNEEDEDEKVSSDLSSDDGDESEISDEDEDSVAENREGASSTSSSSSNSTDSSDDEESQEESEEEPERYSSESDSDQSSAEENRSQEIPYNNTSQKSGEQRHVTVLAESVEVMGPTQQELDIPPFPFQQVNLTNDWKPLYPPTTYSSRNSNNDNGRYASKKRKAGYSKLDNTKRKRLDV